LERKINEKFSKEVQGFNGVKECSIGSIGSRVQKVQRMFKAFKSSIGSNNVQ
jgi:hypothetical protein